jgi:hypothetical protein
LSMIDEPSQNTISSVVIFFQRSSVNARFALVKISQQESKPTPALEPYGDHWRGRQEAVMLDILPDFFWQAICNTSRTTRQQQ